MTVGELLGILQTLPADMPIVMSSDSEGNSFSTLASVNQGFYRENNTWDGEFVRSTPYPIPEGIALAICLDPTN